MQLDTQHRFVALFLLLMQYIKTTILTINLILTYPTQPDLLTDITDKRTKHPTTATSQQLILTQKIIIITIIKTLI